MSPLPYDAVLPQLAVALDPAAMAEAFADVLRPHGVHVDACRVERVKYRPGRNATLGYLLSLRDGGSRAFEQHVAARLCAAGDAQRTVRASAAALGPSQAGPALHWLPALDMLTWWWPNDRKLRAPRAMCNPSVLREQVLPALMPVLGARAADVTACEVSVVQYVPELRLCTRVDLAWQVRAEVHARRVYGKASREQHGAIAHGLLGQLQASRAWREGRLRTPRALLWHEPTETGWQEGLAGEPLLDAPPQLQAACAAALGAQLAALHATPTTTDRETTPDGLRQRLDEVVRVLWPLLGSAPAAAAQALLAAWPALGESSSTLHGDFHGRNILVEDRPGGPRVALIDLDGICRGPALLELGAWIADAIYRALLEGAPADRDQAAWRVLIEAYVEAGGTRPEPHALRWAVGWQLLTQRAWRCVVNLKPGRYALAPRLIELASELAQPGGAGELAC
jgi:hypothetical protein